MGLWRPTRPLRTNTQKTHPFHYRELECKSRKLRNKFAQSCPTLCNPIDCSLPSSFIHGIFLARNTWSNRQIWLWCTEWSRAKTNRVLPRECTGHSKHPLPTTQEKLYIWTSQDGQHKNQIDYNLCSQRWRSIQSAKSDLEMTVPQIINSLLPNSDLNWRK